MELTVGNNKIITQLIDQDDALLTLQKAAEQLQAEQNDGNNAGASLLAVDGAGSVLCFENTKRQGTCGYSVYGVGPLYREPLVLGFNGELPERCTRRYGLGLGYRVYDTRLMRFLSPDRISPFGAGGLNGYSYCAGDPVNYHDPSGHMREWFSFLLYKKKLASIRSQVKFNYKKMMVETQNLEKHLIRFRNQEASKNLAKMRDDFSRLKNVRENLHYYRQQEKLYRYKKMKARYPKRDEEDIQQKLVNKRSVYQEPLGLEKRPLDIRGA